MANSSTTGTIEFDSELMKNQKHAEVMKPDQAFEVLQTPSGDSLFFSIGTDDIFYVTRELRASDTGWDRIDLCRDLAKQHDGATIKAKSMALAQDRSTQSINVVVVVTINGSDYLYYAFNMSNTVDTWSSSIPWKLATYDDKAKPRDPLTIADVQLMDMSTSANAGKAISQTCSVDVIRAAGDPLHLLDRYYLDFSATQLWQYQPLAIDLKASSVVNYSGWRQSDRVPGIYTFGMIANQQELIFTPEKSVFGGTAPASRLNLPAGTTSMTVLKVLNNLTYVVVAATQGIYIFSPDNQHDHANPILLIPNSAGMTADQLSGISAIAAGTIANRSVLWMINSQRQLLTLSCEVGQEAQASSWSTPVPLLSGVESLAFFLNSSSASNVLFAHTSGQQIIQLQEDPVTQSWSQRSILLPPTDNSDIYEFNSYTTHLTIKDPSNSVASVPLTITAATTVVVYVNNVYYVLGPSYRVEVTSNAMGQVTIVQEVSGLSAASYKVQIKGSKTAPILIDPMANATQRLSAIRSGSDLSNATMQTSDGTSKPLLSSDVDDKTRDAAADSITKLVNIKNQLPADGSTQSVKTKTSVTSMKRMQTGIHSTWGMSFSGNSIQYHEGPSTFASTQTKFDMKARRLVATVGLSWSPSDLPGEIYGGLSNLLDEIESITITAVDDVWHFAVNIAGKVYSAILDCISHVVSVLEFVFSKLKLLIEELIAWLGFLFNWKDIMRTQKVIKNIIRCGANTVLGSLDGVKQSVDGFVGDLEHTINSWAGLPNDNRVRSAGQVTNAASSHGMDSPQSNWALYHTVNGVGSAQSPALPMRVMTTSKASASDNPVSLLSNIALKELQVVTTAGDKIYNDVVPKLLSGNPTDLLKKLLAIVADAALEFTQNIIDALIDVIKVTGSLLLDAMETPIDIPILSWIYKLITGDDLKTIDLLAFIVAIPGTIVYKAATGKTPFPDDDFSSAILNASNLSDISKALSPRFHTSNRIQVARLSDDPAPMISDTATAVLSGFMYLISCVGGTLTILVSNKDKRLPTFKVFPLLSYVAYCASDFTSAWDPNINNSSSDDNWAPRMNIGVMVTSIGKAILDNYVLDLDENPNHFNLSMILDFVINGLWLAPAGKYFDISAKKDVDKLSLAANIGFDASGLLAPARILVARDSPNDLAIIAAQSLCNLTCVATCFGVALDSWAAA